MVFRAVAHERSFSRAAKILSLSQPSVSHQIALLEELREMGWCASSTATEAVPAWASPTPARSCSSMPITSYRRLQLADSQLSALATAPPTRCASAPFPPPLAGFVPSAIRRLRATDGGPRVMLTEVTPSTLEPRFLSGEFDVARRLPATQTPSVASSRARSGSTCSRTPS